MPSGVKKSLANAKKYLLSEGFFAINGAGFKRRKIYIAD